LIAAIVHRPEASAMAAVHAIEVLPTPPPLRKRREQTARLRKGVEKVIATLLAHVRW
jgi:hypothetical protein